MSKGTAAAGKKQGKMSHMHCRRCGKRTYHVRKKVCSSCGFGKSAKQRKYAWLKKD